MTSADVKRIMGKPTGDFEQTKGFDRWGERQVFWVAEFGPDGKAEVLSVDSAGPIAGVPCEEDRRS